MKNLHQITYFDLSDDEKIGIVEWYLNANKWVRDRRIRLNGSHKFEFKPRDSGWSWWDPTTNGWVKQGKQNGRTADMFKLDMIIVGE